jgi:hypothetical protein
LPIISVDPIFSQAFKPTDSFVSQTHFKLQKLAVVIPASNCTGISDSDDEQMSSNGVLAWLAVEQRNVS